MPATAHDRLAELLAALADGDRESADAIAGMTPEEFEAAFGDGDEEPDTATFAADSSGHEHKGKGKGGGQFVKQGGEGGSEETPEASPKVDKTPKVVTPKANKKVEAAPTRKAPGSQLAPDQVARAKALGMTGTLPPADVPVGSIKFAPADVSPEDTFADGPAPFPGAVLTEVKPGVHRWTKPDEGGGTATAPPPPGKPTPTHDTPDAGHTATAIAATLAAEFPELAGSPGLLGKVRTLARAALDRVNLFLVANESRIAAAASILDAAMTTPEDMKRNGFVVAGGGSGVGPHATADAFLAATGIPGHIGAKLIATVLVKGWGLAREALHLSDADALDAAAELVAGMVDAACEGLGLPPADVGAMRDWLTILVKSA